MIVTRGKAAALGKSRIPRTNTCRQGGPSYVPAPVIGFPRKTLTAEFHLPGK
jgi:hypothetical protein